MRKRRLVITISLALLAIVPLYAVFKETDLPKTLRVLHFELKNTYKNLLQTNESLEAYEKSQHKTLVELMENCNELSLMLYSQQQDFTFDLTYALDEVTKQYMAFNSSKVPYNEIINNLEIEIDRYDKLSQTLKNLPPAFKGYSEEEPAEEELEGEDAEEDGGEPEVIYDEPEDSLSMPPADTIMVNDSILLTIPSFMESDENPYLLDGQSMAERDSCLMYADRILDVYWERLFMIDENNSYYQEADEHLLQAYNYALQRYGQVQKNIFVNGQTDYLTILRRFPMYYSRAIGDCREKYSITSDKSRIISEWRGPMVIGFVTSIIIYILLAIGLANLLLRVVLRKVKFFRTDFFRERSFLFTTLAGIVIFAVTVMVVDICSSSHFIKMAMPLVAELAWLVAAIFSSVLIRMAGDKARHAVAGYMPIIVIALVIISFRIVFIPNSLINILFPPILLLAALWQLAANRKWSRELPLSDRSFIWLSMVIMTAAAIVSFVGYVMIALLLVIWWIFQLTFIQTLMAIGDLMSRYYESHITVRKNAYKLANPGMPFSGKASFIEVSWLYDLFKTALIPVLTVWTIPLCFYMAGNVFDLSSVVMEYFYKPILNVENVINLSLFKVAIVVSLGFIFAYLNYAAKAFYRVWRTRSAISKLGEGVAFKETNINFTLADNIITLAVWGSFIVIAFLMLQIPATAITIITTGLATGMGFAMKDVLNNFFYGLQLMSGRLRVGDVIECDGIRGTVDSMSYQSTQILAGDGSIIAFPNSTLFSKNFKNLTRNNYYQMLKIPVGIKYGSNVEKVRELIIEALKVLCVRDKYGRNSVDPSFGIEVRFSDFGDNSVNLEVIQKVTVDIFYTYAAKAKEIIYNTLNENGIEIPFPQRDLYIKSMPDK